MLNTYIKNRGLSQTFVHNNNRNQFNEINWDADYDGNIANVSVTYNTDGIKNHFDVSLDNDDLASILNTPSINMPIDKRLQMDFVSPTFRHDPRILQVELPDFKPPKLSPRTPSYIFQKPDSISSPSTTSIDELIRSPKSNDFLSSPLPNEEFIVPITIDDKTADKYTFTPKKRRIHKKTHKTYKVYKKQKSLPRSNSSSKSKTKSTRNTKTKSFSLF